MKAQTTKKIRPTFEQDMAIVSHFLAVAADFMDCPRAMSAHDAFERIRKSIKEYDYGRI